MAKKEEDKTNNVVHIGEAVPEEEFENKELRDKAIGLRDQVEENFWEFSIVLGEIYDGAVYKGWGFDTWKEYVSSGLDFSLRKAQQLVKLQGWYAKLPPNVQKWIRKMGWTKARLLVGKLTADNAKMWKDRLDGKTRAEMKEIMEQMAGGGDGSGAEGGDSGEGGESGSAPENTSKRLSFSLFTPQYNNVQETLKRATKFAESEKPGHLLDLICTEWTAQTVGVENPVDYLVQLENMLGLKLVAYSESKDVIIYGEDLLDKFEVEAAGESDEEEAESEE